jgi:AraC-like DNA-binding protein
VSNVESALRGGAVMLLLLLAILLFRDGRKEIAARIAGLYALGVGAYVVESASAFVGHTPAWLLPLRIVGGANPVIFYLLSAALFTDDFTPRRTHFAAWAGMVMLSIACVLSGDRALHLGASLLSLTCNVVAIRYAIVGRSEDLVEERRRFRTFFIIAAALYSLVQISAEAIVASGPPRASLELLNSLGITVMTMIFSIALLALNRDSFIFSASNAKPLLPQPGKSDPKASKNPVPDATGKPEEVLLAALRRVMHEDKIYREEALSVGALSDKLKVPDYRLRRLINQRLSYRNFTAFLNDYRLADVATALSDPMRANVPILTIALECGFQSIGPFNRAFKAHTGMTPTEFRQKELARAQTLHSGLSS